MSPQCASPAAVLHMATASIDEVPDGDDWLTAPERVVLSGLRFEKRRLDWRLGRWVAKSAVAAHLGSVGVRTAAHEIGILACADGAPAAVLRNGEPPPGLSLSHAGGLGFAIAGPFERLGCDVERLAPRSRRFVEDYFTPGEVEAIDSLGPDKGSVLTNLTWSAKESVLKALREGLRMDTRAVEVLIEDGWADGPADDASRSRWKPFTAVTTGGCRFEGWWRVSEGFVWTVATSPRTPC